MPDQLPKSIVLLGPPGSGKDTQAAALAERFGYLVLTTGDILRSEMDKGTDLGKRVAGYVERGDLVPAALINELVDHELGRNQSFIQENGLVFNGYPRLPGEPEHLETLLDRFQLRPVAAIYLAVDDNELFDRLTERAETLGRSDDSPTVLRHRIAVYHKETAPILAQFRTRGQLITIDGNRPIPQVTQEIMSALERWEP